MGVSDRKGIPMDLSEDLGGFSIWFIVASLIVLGIVLGPVNYWFVRRRGNALLFYLVTPLAAVIGSLALIGGTLLAEGGERCRQAAVLYHNGGSDAFLIDCYGVRSGLFARTLRLPEETLLIPERDWTANNPVVDIADREMRVGGLLRPRAVAEYTLARPVAGRMRVTAKWNAQGRCTVENGLGHDLLWVSASDGDGRVAWARDIPAGGDAVLEASRPPEDIEALLAKTPGVGKWSGPVPFVAAEAAGLPYPGDGGLRPDRVAARYFFVGVEAGGDGHE
jgi:hypothetical protein